MNNYKIISNEVLNAIDNINSTTVDTELTVLESLMSVYDKMDLIQEYYEGDDINSFMIFQEEYIFQEGEKWEAIKADVKKQGEGQSKLKKAFTLLFRFIKAIIKSIKGQLNNTKTKDNTNKVKDLHEEIKKQPKEIQNDYKEAITGVTSDSSSNGKKQKIPKKERVSKLKTVLLALSGIGTLAAAPAIAKESKKAFEAGLEYGKRSNQKKKEKKQETKQQEQNKPKEEPKKQETKQQEQNKPKEEPKNQEIVADVIERSTKQDAFDNLDQVDKEKAKNAEKLAENVINKLESIETKQEQLAADVAKKTKEYESIIEKAKKISMSSKIEWEEFKGLSNEPTQSHVEIRRNDSTIDILMDTRLLYFLRRALFSGYFIIKDIYFFSEIFGENGRDLAHELKDNTRLKDILNSTVTSSNNKDYKMSGLSISDKIEGITEYIGKYEEIYNKLLKKIEKGSEPVKQSSIDLLKQNDEFIKYYLRKSQELIKLYNDIVDVVAEIDEKYRELSVNNIRDINTNFDNIKTNTGDNSKPKQDDTKQSDKDSIANKILDIDEWINKLPRITLDDNYLANAEKIMNQCNERIMKKFKQKKPFIKFDFDGFRSGKIELNVKNIRNEIKDNLYLKNIDEDMDPNGVIASQINAMHDFVEDGLKFTRFDGIKEKFKFSISDIPDIKAFRFYAMPGIDRNFTDKYVISFIEKDPYIIKTEDDIEYIRGKLIVSGVSR